VTALLLSSNTLRRSRLLDFTLKMSDLSLSLKPAPWQIAALILSLICCAAFFVPIIPAIQLSPIFEHLFYTYDPPAAGLGLALTVIAAVILDQRGKAKALFGWIGTHPGWISGIAFSVAALGAIFVYHTHPLSMDEYAPRLQSEIFAAGKLIGQVPLSLTTIFMPSFFNGWFINLSQTNGALASVYWPAFALLMAPFSFFGVPWLCNPVLTAATFLGLSRLLELLVQDAAVRGAVLAATLVSPAILINGMSYYGMPLQLLCTVMFTYGLLRGTRPYHWAAGAWAAIGLTAVNPVPFILYAVPWVFWIIKKSPARWRTLAALASGGLPLTLLFGLGWKIFLMKIFATSQAELNSDSIISILSIFQPPTPSLLIARAIALIKLCVWAMPGLPVLAFLALGSPNRHSLSSVFFASALLTLTGYLFVPFDQGHGWGYRYFHAAWLTLPVLAGIGIQQLIQRQGELEKARMFGFLLVVSLGSLLLALPLRAIQVESFVTNHLQQIPAHIPDNTRQVVFIHVGCGAYTADLVQNDPFLRGHEIRLVSQGHEQDARIAATLGPHPRFAASGPCGDRWRLD